MVAKFLLNIVLHNVGLSWIFESNRQLEYDIDSYNPNWVTNVPWYKYFICKKLHGTVSEMCILNAITGRYNVCVILMKMRNNSYNMLLTVSAEVVKKYHQIRQRKHSIHYVQPMISLIFG